MTKTSRARGKHRPLKRAGISLLNFTWRTYHSGPQDLDPRNGSIFETLSSYKMNTRIDYRVIQRQPKMYNATTSCLRRFLPPLQKAGRVWQSCLDLHWTRDSNTLHRSEIDGIAEGVVRRVKEGTARAMVKSIGVTVRWNVIAPRRTRTTK